MRNIIVYELLYAYVSHVPPGGLENNIIVIVIIYIAMALVATLVPLLLKPPDPLTSLSLRD